MAISSFYAFPLHNKGAFVYYQSLLSKDNPGAKLVAQGASTFLYGASNLASPYTNRGQERITQALSILSKMINYEAAKEESALREIQEKILKIKNINIPSVKEDPYGFIVILNETLKGHEKALTELELERKRILQAKNEFVNKNKKEIHKLIKEQPELSSLLHNLSNSLENIDDKKGNRMTSFTSLGKHNSIASKITTKIIEKYASDLIQVSANKGITINGRTITIVTGLIAEEIRKTIFLEQGKITEKTAQSYISQIGQHGTKIDTIISNMIKNQQQLYNYADSFGAATIDDVHFEKTLNAHNSAKRARDINKILQKSLSDVTLEGVSDKEFKKQLALLSKEIVATTRSFSPQIYIESEMMSAMDFTQMAMETFHTGSYTKDDAIAFKVIIDDEFQNNSKIKQLQNKLSELQKTSIAKMSYIKGTAEEYQKNSEIIQETMNQIQQEYASLSQELEIEQATLEKIVSLVKFHDNIKSYDTINSKTKSFSGGSIGKNISENLTNFTNLLNRAGYGTTSYDQTWLTTAIINTGKGLIGESLVGDLEKYFSTLMGLLLFDDAYYTVSQGIDFFEDNLSAPKDGIHLYNLNGQYVPASFILSETYKSLTDEIYKQNSHGVTVTIKARPAQNKTFTSPYDWLTERDAALAESKITIDFMANFLTFLDNLSQAFNS